MNDAGGRLVVDVVIDNYNYGEYLPAAIASVRAQSHPAVNLIVVDDGSTDGSPELLARLGEEATVIVKENGGQASALNAGFERCEGDVVMFLDADDVLRPDATAAIAAAFAADPELTKVQFRSEVIDAAGAPTGTIKPSDHLEMPNGDMRRAELAYPFDLVWMSTSANAFRRRALGRIMPIPERDFRSCADYYLVHLAALLGPVRSLPDVGAGYRVHGANTYEPQAAELDLAHVRDSIRVASATAAELLRLAAELSLPHPPRILSLADLGNRMISLRLDPAEHPLDSDSRRSLIAGAAVAVRRRDDIAAAMKAMFVLWFGLAAVAPRRATAWLAELFLFPERRRPVNRLLEKLHRSGGGGDRAVTD